MKKVLLICAFFATCHLLLGCASEQPGEAYLATFKKEAQDPLLKGIQKKIMTAFSQSIMQSKSKAIDEIAQKLEKTYEENPKNLVQYWRAYTAYYQAIFYTVQEETEQSERYANKGIDMLKNMEGKNAEDYTLLSMIQGFSIQFKSGIGAALLSSKATKNAEKALALNENNPRAYFVLGSNDFYTPEQYGGGKRAEELLLKAISLPAQEQPNPYLPSWGIEESYELLIKHYIKQKQWDKAQAHFDKASSKFPNSYTINSLASKIADQ